MSPEQIAATAIEDLLEVRLKLSYFYPTQSPPANHQLVQGGKKEGDIPSHLPNCNAGLPP